MKLLFVADLHYALRHFDWLAAHPGEGDALIIGGDLLDLAGRWRRTCRISQGAS
jgi:Icc-related predicted phosphoesterase